MALTTNHLISDERQEPITRSVELPYQAYVAAFVKTGLFFLLVSSSRNRSVNVYTSNNQRLRSAGGKDALCSWLKRM